MAGRRLGRPVFDKRMGFCHSPPRNARRGHDVAVQRLPDFAHTDGDAAGTTPGTPLAWDRFVRRYHPKIYGWCQSLGPSRGGRGGRRPGCAREADPEDGELPVRPVALFSRLVEDDYPARLERFDRQSQAGPSADQAIPSSRPATPGPISSGGSRRSSTASYSSWRCRESASESRNQPGKPSA